MPLFLFWAERACWDSSPLTPENMGSFLAKSTTRVMAGVMILVNSLNASRSTLSPSDVGATGDWPIFSGYARKIKTWKIRDKKKSFLIQKRWFCLSITKTQANMQTFAVILGVDDRRAHKEKNKEHGPHYYTTGENNTTSHGREEFFKLKRPEEWNKIIEESIRALCGLGTTRF